MLRTRDLVLFIVVLFFLVFAIAGTLISQTTTPVMDIVAFTDDDMAEGSGATTPETQLDRQSVIDRLRAKLQDSTQRIEPAASVEAPMDEEVPVDGALTLHKCLYPDDALAMVPQWPLTDVSVEVQEGARIVFVSETVVVSAASTGTTSSVVSEEVITTVIPLLRLPITPRRLAESACVPSEVIGVTSGGILMFNGDINSYRRIPENVLIGYARDGFPIYGVYAGEVDKCGGYEHPSGYRYTISTERDYIVGCYVGAPASFSL